MTFTSTSSAPLVLDGFDASSSTSQQPCRVSLMPFSITHDGPANILKFFHARPIPNTTHTEAAFRGRRVVSTEYALPQGYKGIVYTTTVPLGPSIPSKSVGTKRGPSTPRKSVSSKRVKLSGPDDDGSDKDAVELGLRRSPRKAAMQRAKAAMAKARQFSLDSDDEDEEEDQDEEGDGEADFEENEVQAGAEESGADSQKTQVVEEIVDKSTTSTDPGATGLAVPLATPSALSATSSFTLVDQTVGTEVKEGVDEVSDLHKPALGEQEEKEEEQEDLPLERDERHLVPNASFDTIQLWHADHQMNLQDDLYARVLSEWPRIAQKIHSY